MLVTALARWSSGPVIAGPEGNGGQPPRLFGDRTRYYTNPSREASLWSRSFMGRPSGHNASPWSRKPEDRKNPRSTEGRARGNAEAETPAGGLTRKDEDPRRAQPAGFKPCRGFFLLSGQSGYRNALYPPRGVSPGQRAQVVCIRPCAPVLQASVYPGGKRERQNGLPETSNPGLVASQAVGPAGVGDAPGNGRGVGWSK